MIDIEIKKIVEHGKKLDYQISEEKAFDILVCSLYCFKSLDLEKNWYDLIHNTITDGSNDGGFDFVYFDDDNSKVIIGQNKFSKNVDVNGAISEIEKINRTILDFDKNNTSLYNKEVKRLYRNALDRLNDENVGNIEVVFSSLSKFNEEKVNTKLFSMGRFSELTFLDEKEIEKMIGEIRDNLPVVSEYKFSLDRTNNYLEYKSDYYEGVVVNIDAHSLKSAYEKYEKDGLFNLNIRRYIKSKAVDDAIINTIIKDSDNFWFLNNGITVACDDFIIDGDKIKIYDFSIVNGGQTTTLISQKINDKIQNFYIMCKIIKKISTSKESNNIQFFNKIAESTNSQKPIQPRDLKSNAPEMISLQSLLKEKGYFLEIKRGVSAPRKFANKKIKNEDFAQIYFSFVCQKPGTSRSNKKSLFSNNTNYKTIFQQKFRKKPEKIDFITNLIDLNQYIDEAILSLKNVGDNTLDINEMNILVNSKQTLVALFGFLYRLSNNDFDIRINSVSDLSGSEDFIFGNFISNYKKDNISELVKNLIVEFTQFLTDMYNTEFEIGRVTSVSNFFKTDKKYVDTILKKYVDQLKTRDNLESTMQYYGDIFKR